jgi:1,2-phenylacetyl-CoA epoxidase catalytic subunit
MWVDRLLADAEGRRRFEEAADEVWPYALGVLAAGQRGEFEERVRTRLPFDLPEAQAAERGSHSDELRGLLEQMTEVRRSVPGARW